MIIESLVLVEGENVDLEELRSLTGSLMNAKGLLIGSVPGGRVVLHVASNAAADLGNAMLAYSQVSGVTGVMPLTLWK